MSSLSVSPTSPTSPSPPFPPQSSSKPISSSAPVLHFPLPPHSQEGFMDRLKKRTPSFPKSFRSTAVDHNSVARDPQDLAHTGLSSPIAAYSGTQTPSVRLRETSSPSTEHLTPSSKKTLFGKLAAALSSSAAPRPPSPTLSMDEERTSMSTIRPHTVPHGARYNLFQRRVTSSEDIEYTSLHSSCEDLGPFEEDKVFEYAEAVCTNSPRPRRSSRSLPLPPSGPPTGPLPPLPASIPIPVSPPRLLPYVPSPDLPGHIREVPADLQSRPEVPNLTVSEVQDADADLIAKQRQEILRMRLTIADQQKEIDTLRKGANRVDKRSVASQTDGISHMVAR